MADNRNLCIANASWFCYSVLKLFTGFAMAALIA